jgi:hypothetical protein
MREDFPVRRRRAGRAVELAQPSVTERKVFDAAKARPGAHPPPAIGGTIAQLRRAAVCREVSEFLSSAARSCRAASFAAETGFDCHFVKPVSVHDLLGVLDERVVPGLRAYRLRAEAPGL